MREIAVFTDQEGSGSSLCFFDRFWDPIFAIFSAYGVDAKVDVGRRMRVGTYLGVGEGSRVQMHCHVWREFVRSSGANR